MSGVDLIRAERVRQIVGKNYSLKGDKGRKQTLVALAVSRLYDSEGVQRDFDKRTLITAGALIAAAIDSLED